MGMAFVFLRTASTFSISFMNWFQSVVWDVLINKWSRKLPCSKPFTTTPILMRSDNVSPVSCSQLATFRSKSVTESTRSPLKVLASTSTNFATAEAVVDGSYLLSSRRNASSPSGSPALSTNFCARPRMNMTSTWYSSEAMTLTRPSSKSPAVVSSRSEMFAESFRCAPMWR